MSKSLFILAALSLLASGCAQRLPKNGGPNADDTKASTELSEDHTLFGLAGMGTKEQLDHNPWTIYPDSGRTMLDDARSRGIEIWRLNVSWGLYEPEMGRYDSYQDPRIPKGYIRFLKDQLEALSARGFKVVVALQYWDPAPEWIWSIPNARYKNQYGAEFKVDTTANVVETGGLDFPNIVFNPRVREAMARFEQRFFEDFKDYKDKIWAMDLTLGGGGDAIFPHTRNWKGKGNSYWAFDENAQSTTRPGSLAGPNPVPGWVPGGERGTNNNNAKKFLNWYLESGNQAFLWKLNTLKKQYAGRIILYSDLYFKDIPIETDTRANLDGSSELSDDPYLSPAVGASDGRYLKGIKNLYTDEQIIVHHTGLEQLKDEEISFAKKFFKHLGGENAILTKEQLTPQTTLKGILNELIDKVKRYRLSEFVWMFSDGLYIESLRDRGYDLRPEYYAEKIQEVNGRSTAISGITVKKISKTETEVSWRTDEPADSRVIFGEDKLIKKNPQSVYDRKKTTEHRIAMTRLNPGISYYFEVGSDNGKNYSLSEVRRLDN